MGTVHKFLNVYEVIEVKKDTSGCKWLQLQDVNKNYYYQINDIGDSQEKKFYDEICNLLDEALYMVLYITDCGPRKTVPGGISREIVDGEEMRNICVRLSREYREYIQEHDYMKKQKGALNAGCMINDYIPVTLE